jgi:hypothetical protein
MQRHQFLTKDAQLLEEFPVGGQRDAREVDLEEPFRFDLYSILAAFFRTCLHG